MEENGEASKMPDWREWFDNHWREHCYKPLIDGMDAFETVSKAYCEAVDAVQEALKEVRTSCRDIGIETSSMGSPGAVNPVCTDSPLLIA